MPHQGKARIGTTLFEALSDIAAYCQLFWNPSYYCLFGFPTYCKSCYQISRPGILGNSAYKPYSRI